MAPQAEPGRAQPTTLIRRGQTTPAAVSSATQPSEKPVPVVFTNSLKEARWAPSSGTLLELAEARGLEPEFSCREGNCGTCRTKLVKGAVAYVKQPAAKIDADEVLLCCAVPAEQEGGLQIAV